MKQHNRLNPMANFSLFGLQVCASRLLRSASLSIQEFGQEVYARRIWASHTSSTTTSVCRMLLFALQQSLFIREITKAVFHLRARR